MHSISKSLTVALLPALGAATRYLSGPADQSQLLMNGGPQALQAQDATDTDSTGTSPNNQNAGNFPGVNDCGVSSFVGLSLPGISRARVEDCWDMLYEIIQDREWVLDATGVVEVDERGQIISSNGPVIIQKGSCAFSAVVSAGQQPGLFATLGNADCIDLTVDSIRKYGQDGTVGCQGGFNMYTQVSAAGAMPCDSPNAPNGQQVSVDWTLAASGPSVDAMSNMNTGDVPPLGGSNNAAGGGAGQGFAPGPVQVGGQGSGQNLGQSFGGVNNNNNNNNNNQK